jgi:hypothetical protein
MMMVSPIASHSQMQQHNGDIQQQQPQSLSLLKIPTPALSTFSSQFTLAATSPFNVGGGGGVYSIASCNNSPQQLQPPQSQDDNNANVDGGDQETSSQLIAANIKKEAKDDDAID